MGEVTLEEWIRFKKMLGRRVRHFKNKEYLVIDYAWHTENEETVVIYKSLYGNYTVYCRPIKMFLSKVDKEKYPGVTQEYRMELIED